MGATSSASYGPPFGANVVLPKQLLLEAVESVVKKRKVSESPTGNACLGNWNPF